MTKQILTFVSVALFVALITSGTCSGPIDQIFVGWRDSVGCSVGGGWNCLGGGMSADIQRENGALALIFLLFFTLFIYGLFRATRWFWRKLGEE